MWNFLHYLGEKAAFAEIKYEEAGAQKAQAEVHDCYHDAHEKKSRNPLLILCLLNALDIHVAAHWRLVAHRYFSISMSEK